MKKEKKFNWIGMSLIIAWGLFCLPTPVWAQGSGEKTSTEKPSEKKPDLQFEQKTFDFGDIYKGAEVSHTFKFTNKGNEVLKVERVRTSCGCTAALISSKSIKPGENGEIESTFRSKNFRGRITKKIYVHSNDPDEGVLQLGIKGNVIDEISLDPNSISFNMVEKGKEHKKSFHIKQLGKNQLKILDIKPSLGFLSAKVGSVDKVFDMKKGEQLDYEVEVTLASDAPPGRFNGILTIKTNLDKQPDIKYFVRGVIR